VERARVPTLGFGKSGWQQAGPDPLAQPEYYRSILSRRFIAWLVDSAILLVLMGGAFFVLVFTKIISFGLLALPVSLGFLVVPLVFYTVLLGGPGSATPGMRIVGITLRSWDNRPPDYVQALLRTLLHYATVVFLSPLVLIVVLCNGRHRALHDYLSGTVVVNCLPGSSIGTSDGQISVPPAKR